jgi:hypothetical protein
MRFLSNQGEHRNKEVKGIPLMQGIELIPRIESYAKSARDSTWKRLAERSTCHDWLSMWMGRLGNSKVV